jgi:CheY-like chemotaxis protein
VIHPGDGRLAEPPWSVHAAELALCPNPSDVTATMRILIVESNRDLAVIWAGFLVGQGMVCTLATSEGEAQDALRHGAFEAVVLDMEMSGGGALRVADFATYRDPDIPIIAVTARGFFSDSAIFELIPNARGLLRTPLKPEDMAALVEHYGGRHASGQRGQVSSG